GTCAPRQTPAPAAPLARRLLWCVGGGGVSLGTSEQRRLLADLALFFGPPHLHVDRAFAGRQTGTFPRAPPALRHCYPVRPAAMLGRAANAIGDVFRRLRDVGHDHADAAAVEAMDVAVCALAVTHRPSPPSTRSTTGGTSAAIWFTSRCRALRTLASVMYPWI